jgi:hypothetical protein
MRSFHRVLAVAMASTVCLAAPMRAATPESVQLSMPLASGVQPLVSCGGGSFTLAANPTTIPVGGTFSLTWCNPSYYISGDASYSVNSYSLYLGGSAGGPFSLQGSGISSGAAGLSSIGIIGASAGDVLYLFVRAIGVQGTIAGPMSQNIDSNIVHVTVTGSTPTGCSGDSSTLCLFGNRFQATAKFRRYGSSTMETAVAHAYSDTTGFFSTVLASDVDVVVKMVNFCSLSGTWAAYIGGTTDLEVDIAIVDTTTGHQYQAMNALGNRWLLIRDTAFQCP